MLSPFLRIRQLRLATRENGTPDGQLVVLSANAERCLPVHGWGNLLAVMERWEDAQSELQATASALASGAGEAYAVASLLAPLPRSWQWLDGSAFPTHGALMQVAFGLDPIPTDRPLMYQGMSDKFLSGTADVPFPDEALGIDFEGEFGVIVDAVPMGTSVAEAQKHIRLVVQINDWSLRTLAPIEMKTGFGWVQAKPACSVAPFAVTLDELGDGWKNGRVCCDLIIDLNGDQFGRVDGAEMAFSFPELVAHAARTRDLVAGTMIGSGTVSNAEYRRLGSSCLSERRAIEIIDSGQPSTPFMRFGDRVRMVGTSRNGEMPFGSIDQRVVCA